MAVGLVVTDNLLSTMCVMGLEVLRKKTPLLSRTNRQYEAELVSAQRNSTVNISVPAPIAVAAVVPSHVPPGAESVTPTSVPITLSEWYRAPFAFSDKQLQQVNRNIIPDELAEAIAALAEYIEADVWAKSYKKFYGFAGAPGVTPFGTSNAEWLAADKVANDQRMSSERFMVMDTAAWANWQGLRRNFDRNFTDVPVEVLWSQLVPTHTAGSAAGATTNAAGYALGVTTITLASAGTGSILAGDIFTIAGDSQTYTVLTGDADVSGGGTVTFSPGLKVAITTAATAITVKASHVVNLLSDRKAIAFAMAPMTSGVRVSNTPQEAIINDPDSGLGFRLRVDGGQHYQTEWAVDAIWGSAVPRPERGVRLAG